jgi:hypothetical protein
MKASELRIGNYLQKASGNGWFEVTIEDLERIDSEMSASSPIPITKEWLIRFGFEYHHDTPHPNKVYRKNWSEGHFDLEHIISFYFGGNFISVELKYVNQLQNLYFAITQEELEINDINITAG